MSWQDQSLINAEIAGTLKAAVGAEAFAAMTEQFADDIESLVARLKSCLDSGDEQGGREAGHALKGAAANIGLQRLSALAHAFEAGEKSDQAALDGLLTESLQALRSLD